MNAIKIAMDMSRADTTNTMIIRVNMIVDGKCFSCGAVWGLSKPAKVHTDGICQACRPVFAPDIQDIIDDEQMKHREAPSDEEIDAMHASVGSDSENYRDAH
jgi:hypothetical protein